MHLRTRAILILLVATVSLWLVVSRLGPQWQARELEVVAQAFVEAAAKGDSAGLVRSSNSIQPVKWGLMVHRRLPDLPRVAAAGMRAAHVAVGLDSAHVIYALPVAINDRECGSFDELYLRFARTGGAWRVARAALSCF
jgi:hypothetical protein